MLLTWNPALAADDRPTTQPERTGPLAGLPSKSGPHIEQIKALGDNQWLRLPEAAGDPCPSRKRRPRWSG